MLAKKRPEEAAQQLATLTPIRRRCHAGGLRRSVLDTRTALARCERLGSSSAVASALFPQPVMVRAPRESA